MRLGSCSVASGSRDEPAKSGIGHILSGNGVGAKLGCENLVVYVVPDHNKMSLLPSPRIRIVKLSIREVLSNKFGVRNLQDIRVASVLWDSIWKELAGKTANC